jgi:cAMP-dependent protein kinase regulator
VAEKQEGNELPKIVFRYEQGDYFGELALLNNSPRQASVKAITPAKVAVVSREGFKRVFGHIQQAFQEQSQKYHS